MTAPAPKKSGAQLFKKKIAVLDRDNATRYKFLKLASTLILIFGALLITLSIVIPLIIFMYVSGTMQPVSDGCGRDCIRPDFLKTIINSFGFFPIFLLGLPWFGAGIFTMAAGEMIKLFISMHDDLSGVSEMVYQIGLHLTDEQISNHK